MSDHPAYPRPTIVEAVAEIQLEMAAFDPSAYGRLLQRLGADYPALIPEPLLESSMEVSGAGLAHRVDAGMRARYPRSDGTDTILLSSQALTFSRNEPYPGWEPFLAGVRFAWEKASGVLSPSGVRRIGLRYLNRIPWTPGERVGDWIASSGLVPAELVEQRERFMMRLDQSASPGNRLRLFLADVTSPGGQERWMVFDVDTILEADLQPDWAVLEPELARLHERAFAAFSVSCGVRLLRHLREETP